MHLGKFDSNTFFWLPTTSRPWLKRHCVTYNNAILYCTSIENYKRPGGEVESLLNLARDKFRRLIKEAQRFADEGVRVNVIGNLTLLPPDLQQLIQRAMEVTSKNTRATLNVAFSYTSREEMTNAVKTLSNAVNKGI